MGSPSPFGVDIKWIFLGSTPSLLDQSSLIFSYCFIRDSPGTIWAIQAQGFLPMDLCISWNLFNLFHLSGCSLPQTNMHRRVFLAISFPSVKRLAVLLFHLLLLLSWSSQSPLNCSPLDLHCFWQVFLCRNFCPVSNKVSPLRQRCWALSLCCLLLSWGRISAILLELVAGAWLASPGVTLLVWVDAEEMVAPDLISMSSWHGSSAQWASLDEGNQGPGILNLLHLG